jgi:hypothetical protein
MTATLSLKLPPEIAKIMPWIIAAKASGNPKQVVWAKREYEIAAERARARARWEAEAEERRIERERELSTRTWREECWREYDRLVLEHYKREDFEKKRWASLGFPFAFEEGFDEHQPGHSSQKGFRRFFSEFGDRRSGFGLFFSDGPSGHRSWRNEGRKPRKSWYK